MRKIKIDDKWSVQLAGEHEYEVTVLRYDEYHVSTDYFGNFDRAMLARIEELEEQLKEAKK